MKTDEGRAYIREGILAMLVPPRRLSVSEWAGETIRLPSDTAEPGFYNPDRAPYQREILDAAGPQSPTREITLVFGAQMGKTLTEMIVMAYYIKEVPMPQIFAFSDDGMIRRFVKTKFNPFLLSNPVINEQLGRGQKTKGDTLTEKQYAGGTLYFIPANVETKLRSSSAAIIIMDEEDTYDSNLQGNGDPVDLIKKRANTYHDRRKIMHSSTPLNGDSHILNNLDLSTHEMYYVPCPHCHASITLEWEYMKWETDASGKQVTKVWMECPECGKTIHNSDKTWMLDPANGAKWVATNPDAPPEQRGFFLPTLYAPVGWLGWQNIVQEYVNAMNSTIEQRDSRLVSFYNSVLCRQYKGSDIDPPKATELASRFMDSPYRRGVIPSWVGMLTTGSDVQKNRIETTVVGWGKRGRHLVIDHYFFDVPKGEEIEDPSCAVWDLYRTEILEGTWEREDGFLMKSLANAIDRSYQSTTVDTFYIRQDNPMLYPVVGVNRLRNGSVIPNERQARKISGARYWETPVDVLKNVVYSDLKRTLEDKDEEAPAYNRVEFPADLPMEYFEQLVAEKYEYDRKSKGFLWVKTRDRNEALDCMTYNYAMHYLTGMNTYSDQEWDRILAMQSDSLKRAREAKEHGTRMQTGDRRKKRVLSSGVN